MRKNFPFYITAMTQAEYDRTLPERQARLEAYHARVEAGEIKTRTSKGHETLSEYGQAIYKDMYLDGFSAHEISDVLYRMVPRYGISYWRDKLGLPKRKLIYAHCPACGQTIKGKAPKVK